MPLTAMILFSASIVGILLLFFLKRVELSREKRFAENLRGRADVQALRLKVIFQKAESGLTHVPWFLAALIRYIVHVSALSFARVARTAAVQAHHLADFVSHKRNFERKETKSQFLKEVGEYKNGKEGDGGTVVTR